MNALHKSHYVLNTLLKALFPLVIVGLLLSVQIALMAPANTIVVNSAADNTTANDEACTLREAINNANDTTDGQTTSGDCAAGNPGGADTITFDSSLNGTAIVLNIGTTHDDTNASGDLDILTDLTITGNGAANTIIDGNDDKRIFEVVTGLGVTSFTVNNLTLRNARVTVADDGRDGGAIFNAEAAATITVNSAILSSNVVTSSTTADGGGIYSDGSVIITASVLTNNIASGNGGGISQRDGSLTISNSTFSGNNANFEVDRNREGGGVHTVNNCTGLTITDSTISGNTAQRGGGISNNCSGDAFLTNVTISGNSADVGTEDPELRRGGGIYHSPNSTATLHLDFVTITENWASGTMTVTGGGLNSDDANSQIEMSNTIIVNNMLTSPTAAMGADCHDASGTAITSSGYNLVGVGTGCPSNGTGDQTTSNAGLLALTNNGGDTETHALDTGSPALDQIPSGTNGCGTDVTNDQRGEPRPEAAGGLCDVGAYEAAPVPAPEIDVQGNGQSIASGDTSPGLADGTDFGTVTFGDAAVVHTFTISNSGTAALNLTGTPGVTLANGTHFAVNAQPAVSTIGSGGATTFQIAFAPAGAGTFTDTVSIANDDDDENPYTFVIGGTAGKADTTTTITADAPDSSAAGSPYTVTVVVSSTAGIPTGSVDVDDGEGGMCQITLAGGSGSCSLTTNTVGNKTLTATYNGDADFNPSSDTESHAVKSGTTTTITGDAPDPTIVGQSYTVTATVTSAAGTPTGSVDVDDGDGNMCQITLTAGAGSCSLASTSAGVKTLTATYGGDADFNPSSDAEPHTVQTFDLAVEKGATSSSVDNTTTITYTIVVSNVGQFDATDVVVSDTLPMSVTFVSFTTSNSTVYDALTGTWNVGALDSGTSAMLTIVATGTNIANEMIVNTATLAGSTPADTTTANNSASATHLVIYTNYLPLISNGTDPG